MVRLHVASSAVGLLLCIAAAGRSILAAGKDSGVSSRGANSGPAAASSRSTTSGSTAGSSRVASSRPTSGSTRNTTSRPTSSSGRVASSGPALGSSRSTTPLRGSGATQTAGNNRNTGVARVGTAGRPNREGVAMSTDLGHALHRAHVAYEAVHCQTANPPTPREAADARLREWRQTFSDRQAAERRLQEAYRDRSLGTIDRETLRAYQNDARKAESSVWRAGQAHDAAERKARDWEANCQRSTTRQFQGTSPARPGTTRQAGQARGRRE